MTRTARVLNPILGMALVLFLTAGCGARDVDTGVTDGGGNGWEHLETSPPRPVDTGPHRDFGKKDTGKKKDGSGPLPPGCPGCRDYVLSQLRMPSSSKEAQNYAYEFKGKKYNALGNIMALLAQQSPGMSVQDSVTGSVDKGKALILMRLQADDLYNDPSVRAQFWIGADGKCCSAINNPAQCSQQAKAGCFNGKATLKIHPTSPKDMLFAGSISGGQLRLGPARLKLRFSMADVNSDLPLTHARVRGAVSNSSISEGVLSGAIRRNEIINILVPQIAKMINATYNDPGVKHTTKEMIRQLFDINQDGKISPSEILNNALIKTFLLGDFDVDLDGQKELSMGMGFAAVRCKITN